MKKLLFFLLGFTILSAGAQTVDEVIQKCSANLGGLEAFNKIKTVKMTGTVTTQGMDLPITIQIINGKATRTDVEVMGSQVIRCYKDGKGWIQNPFAGATTPTDATGLDLADLKQQSMLATPLMDYKARGSQAELQGQEDVNGEKAFKVKLTSKDDGKPTIYYIKTSDYSIIKSESEREIQGQTVTIETWVSEPKDFGGAKFFMNRVQKINGEEFQSIKFDAITLDVTIDEKIFDKP
ncbi:MAG: hypothetical protein Q8941_07025 [Bacteroidota bacterium]|nr:hypothetical protein [Bacteroidota bacterium]